MTTLLAKFSYNSDRKNIIFDRSITIDSMLKSFLNEIHLKPCCDREYITFMYNAMVLNHPNNLNKTLSEVFKNCNYVSIKVIEPNNVRGGK